jgi:hypothetical protein
MEVDVNVSEVSLESGDEFDYVQQGPIRTEDE